MNRLRPPLACAAAGLLLVSASCNGNAPERPAVARPATAAAAAAAAPPPVASAAPARATVEFAEIGQPVQGGWLRGSVPAGTQSLALDGKPVTVDTDGTFFIAFDRDSGPTATLVAQLADGRSVSRAIAVAPRAWRIEQVATPLRPRGVPDAEFQRRRADELARIREARATVTDATGWRQAFAWPVRGRISGLFGSQRIYAGQPGSYHSGTDIAGPTGTLFTAPADGVVILAAEQPFTLEGRLLMIDHGSGLNSAFLHCSELLVRTGDRVRQGQPIGRIGMTGRATGPHLHWSLRWQDARLDPALFAGPMP